MKYGQLVANLLLALASFLMAYVLLRYAPAGHYGSFSFVLVLQAFGMALLNAVVAAPLLILLNSKSAADVAPGEVKGFLLVALGVATAISLLQGGYLWVMTADFQLTVTLAVAGWLQLLRWYGRCEWQNRQVHLVLRSDLLFSFFSITGISTLWFMDGISLTGIAQVLLVTSLIALQPFAAGILRLLNERASWHRVRSGYQRQGKPALLGVLTVEATANFHSYLVVLLSGAAAFAPIAAAMLFFRPLAVVLGSLQQSERPLLVRAVASQDIIRLSQLLWLMRRTAVGAFALNLLAIVLVYLFAPAWLWPEESSRMTFCYALGSWSLIAVLRALRAPATAVLQAYDQFAALARATYLSAACTVPMVLIGWWLAGPLTSLLGVLAGELILALAIYRLQVKLLARRAHA